MFESALLGDPKILTSLGSFLVECGKQMQTVKPFHRHFRDYLKNWDSSLLDVVVEMAIVKKQKEFQSEEKTKSVGRSQE